MTDLLMRRTAEIEGPYRFSLTRTWDERLPIAAWLMLNPSTADHERDDNTVRRVIHFSHANGCGSAVVVNMWPLRTPFPRDLWPAIGAIEKAVIERNNARIRAASDGASVLIAAFGADAGRRHRAHVAQVLGNHFYPLRGAARGCAPFKCLGTTADGWPLHPLARGKHAVPNTRKLNGWGMPR